MTDVRQCGPRMTNMRATSVVAAAAASQSVVIDGCSLAFISQTALYCIPHRVGRGQSMIIVIVIILALLVLPVVASAFPVILITTIFIFYFTPPPSG